jgi:hypothetical protein
MITLSWQCYHVYHDNTLSYFFAENFTHWNRRGKCKAKFCVFLNFHGIWAKMEARSACLSFPGAEPHLSDAAFQHVILIHMFYDENPSYLACYHSGRIDLSGQKFGCFLLTTDWRNWTIWTLLQKEKATEKIYLRKSDLKNDSSWLGVPYRQREMDEKHC